MASKTTLGPEVMRADVKTNIGLTDDARKGIVEFLNSRLCDESTLYTKTKKYHWNVVGPRFQQLHELFKEHYEQLDEMIDEIAERARQLGGKSFGTMEEFVRHSSISEDPGQYPDARRMIANLLKDHEQIIQTLRKNADECDEKYHDMGTNDFLLGAVQNHEKMAWMLRAHLEGKDSE
jgi:starvation-inducible DNA-binding protein